MGACSESVNCRRDPSGESMFGVGCASKRAMMVDEILDKVMNATIVGVRWRKSECDESTV